MPLPNSPSASLSALPLEQRAYATSMLVKLMRPAEVEAKANELFVSMIDPNNDRQGIMLDRFINITNPTTGLVLGMARWFEKNGKVAIAIELLEKRVKDPGDPFADLMDLDELDVLMDYQILLEEYKKKQQQLLQQEQRARQQQANTDSPAPANRGQKRRRGRKEAKSGN